MWNLLIQMKDGQSVMYMTIIKTIDGGYNWTVKSNASSDQLYSVSFIDENNGLAVGTNGIILKTTNGGIDWASE